MGKRSLYVCVLILFTALNFSLNAHGKGDIEEIDVDNFNSWQESFDLEEKKPGKYNIMITAKDFGGNTYVEGPYNLFLDPKSDLPISSITNPYPQMRVVGNLNIVGTCVDDDAVKYVELVIDDNFERPIRAEGAEFWSYYLDTLKMEEGPHKVTVTGYDINGLAGNPVSVNWQLDRALPTTEVLERTMGMLVSGSVKFIGTVSDGNGIKDLYYSLDHGETYTLVKIDRKKTECSFNITVDTKKFDDGPAVIWFKATDMAGSTGFYSFLYYIDNTKPDVQIITPIDKEEVHGKFSIAGYAKDTVGLVRLAWTFGDAAGEIPLIPGNPYWAVDFDTIGSTDKNRKFVIEAEDKAGNVVTVTKTIPFNQELDKPVVTILEPEAQAVYDNNGDVYIRGSIVDDDGVKSVEIQLDNENPIKFNTKGVFYTKVCNAAELKAGKHKIAVRAVDIDDVESNLTTVEIISIGNPPEFSDSSIVTGKEYDLYKPGMEIHPESGKSFSLTATSGIGIKHIKYEFKSGRNAVVENEQDLKNVPSYTFTVPLNSQIPQGIATLKLYATDNNDRTSEYDAVFYITNTSVVKENHPRLVFEDSTVQADGSIISDFDHPVTGFLIGGKVSSVEIVPETPFAIAKMSGNQIQLIPQKGAVGNSEPVVVRVTTDNGKIVETKPFVFKSDTAFPEIKIDNIKLGTVQRPKGKFSVTGIATCKTDVGKVGYRVIPVNIEMKGGVIASVKPGEVPEELKNVPFVINPKEPEVPEEPKKDAKGKSKDKDKKEEVEEEPQEPEFPDGYFTFDINTNTYPHGVYVVEVIAESAGGNKTAKAFAFSTIPDVEADEKGKIPVPKAPVITWINAFDFYGIAVYQGNLTDNFKVFYREGLEEGVNPIEMSIELEDGKIVTGKYNAVKSPTLKAFFAKVDEQDYMSGIPIIVDPAAKEAPKAYLYIDTTANVNSVAYSISGVEVPGGQASVTGNAKLIKPEKDETRWTAEIPLNNLPSRLTKITATVKAESLQQVVVGNILVVRDIPSERIDDTEAVYSVIPADIQYSKEKEAYVLKKGTTFDYYANLRMPITARIVTAADALLPDDKIPTAEERGIDIKIDGKYIRLSALKEGVFNGVKIQVKDALGDIYESDKLNFIADFTAPEMHLITPESQQWLNNIVKISGTANDTMGIRMVEYSTNGGTSWKELKLQGPGGLDVIPTADGYDSTKYIGVTFSEDIDITTLPDGLFRLDLRATDTAGQITVLRTACFKDITPPEVKIIEPLDVDTVNGETLIVFRVHDNGLLSKAEYVSPPVPDKATSTEKQINYLPGKRKQLELGTFIKTEVGTADYPNDEAMSFEFRDEAGNVAVIEAWDFTIDNESDLPITEIHLPGDMEVITRDFTISGVIYDDDGDSTIYYKIDDNEFVQYPSVGTSFSINVPLSAMTDNEHTVTMYAVDINGVKGLESTRTFRVSLEEPKGSVELPTIDTSVRETVRISGWSSDKNGIATVQISLDNGNSYNDVIGTEEWYYDVDTRAIPGGTQVVFLKITDNYGIQGLYSSLINIDNDAPMLQLELPLDDSTTTGTLFFSGFTYDNVDVTDLYVSIRNLEHPSSVDIRKFPLTRIIGETIDITNLENGFYNIEVTGKDKAGNSTNVSRNIHLDKDMPPAVVDVLYPLNGEHKNGVFSIYGQSSSELNIKKIKLYIDDRFANETLLSQTGFFSFELTPEMLLEGVHTYYVAALLENGNEVPSRVQTVTYSPVGPWITIDNFTYGDFAMDRPWIEGRAGYSITEDEVLLSKTKEASKELKEQVAKKRVERVELSFDNGKTFTELSKGERWMFRVENEDMPEGYHFMLIRATMKNGEVAVTRSIIQIDNTNPTVRLISPAAGGRYNQSLNVSGLSNDEIGLEYVRLALRKGDKASYEIPSFIQGLYFDVNVWGATLFDIGIGLTAFDNVVKIQLHWGQYTQDQRDSISNLFNVPASDMRYGGNNIIGVKIIANIGSIPFSYFFGRDWEWLYATFALGANFTRFNETNSGRAQILSCFFGQIEFPKVQLPKAKYFSAFALYTEMGVWFIPTDVAISADADVVPDNMVFQFAIGIRVNIF